MDIFQKLQESFEGSKLQGDILYLPDWNCAIRPNIDSLDGNMAVLSFRISSPEWDRELYECSAAMGTTPENAVGMALASFVFCMMDAIKQMMRECGCPCGGCTCEYDIERIVSEFAGTQHNWHVYKSNIINMGHTPENTGTAIYWDMLSEEIKKRLGNQKLCYVKIYAAKNGENITGECRINDAISPALSEMVAEYTRTWNIEGFGSQKQFIFLAQDSDTYTEYPYTQEKIAEYLKLAVKLFDDCKTEEDYDNYVDLLTEQIGDRDLATELYMFLPEMCAGNAFDQMIYPEDMGIWINDEQKIVYKVQIAGYYRILDALHSEFAAGSFTNELFNKYISVSSTYNAICEAKNKGADITNGGRLFLSYGAYDGYKLR